MKKTLTGILVLISLLLLSAGGNSAFSQYDSLLSTIVLRNSVSYDELIKPENTAKLEAYLIWAEGVDPAALKPKEEKAFYINLYNASTLKLIADNYPVESIRDINSPWSRRIVKLNGSLHSLDGLEKEILLVKYPDSRIHYAVNCAAASCPALSPEAYTSGNLERKLDTAAHEFVNDNDFNNFRITGTPKKRVKARVSMIFNWYRDDFENDHGSLKNLFIEYIKDPEMRKALINNPVDMEFKEYDWSLNSVQ